MKRYLRICVAVAAVLLLVGLVVLILDFPRIQVSRFEKEVSISVPQAESGKTADQKVGQIYVNIRADGTIVIAGEDLTFEQLETRLQRQAALDKRQAIILRGDVNTAYTDLFRVLDLCHKCGLHQVSFASQAPKAAP